MVTKQEGIFPTTDNVWLHNNIAANNHKGTEGIKYHNEIKEILGIDIKDEITELTMEKINHAE